MTDTKQITGERIKSFIERVERLEAEKQGIADDIKETYAEVKSAGFEVKIVRKIVALRKLDVNERNEIEELMELYMSAMGMK